MLPISADEIYESMALENPWWRTNSPADFRENMPFRTYFDGFYRLVVMPGARRSVVLLGPRRVGKTVLVQQTIRRLLREGKNPSRILYLSLDRPIYTGLRLESIVSDFLSRADAGDREEFWFFFDEIQYLPEWERELKSLTDLRPNCRFAVSGSAAAALRAKSNESGAGRFTQFLLPPLTFDEFLHFRPEDSPHRARLMDYAGEGFPKERRITDLDIAWLNLEFENYLRFGGYPEAVLSPAVQNDLPRFIREDIVDKVLLRDLPSLYGITDTRELNRLFVTLCYNTAQEVSLEALSRSSSVAKNTLKRYLEYLDAAFLIRSAYRIDENAKTFIRQTAFKVYLTNPSLRSALFRPLSQDEEAFGPLAETAVFSQWFHRPSSQPFHYARWKSGEIDIVHVGSDQKPEWFVEVKWSDGHLARARDWQAIHAFVESHGDHLASGLVTSRTKFADRRIGPINIEIRPTAIYAWQVGRNAVNSNVAAQLPLDFGQTGGAWNRD